MAEGYTSDASIGIHYGAHEVEIKHPQVDVIFKQMKHDHVNSGHFTRSSVENLAHDLSSLHLIDKKLFKSIKDENNKTLMFWKMIAGSDIKWSFGLRDALMNWWAKTNERGTDRHWSEFLIKVQVKFM